MAGKKGSRSSKTAHVLNLLSGGEAPEAPEQRPAAGTERTEEPQAGPTPPPPPRERPILPPIVEVARTNSEALSETIRSALEKELEEEQAQERALERAEEAGEEHAAQPAAEPPEEPERPDDPAEPLPPSAPMPPKASPMQEQKPVGLPDGAEWVNVMLGLVEEKAERYVKMFGLCPCPRCVADVKALALTRLPAKYVVLPAEHKKPMLSLYQARYDGDVTTQVIYACKAVMDAPRHGAAQPGPARPGLASDRG